MALINCPECGKENVSDSAEMCPNCGYNIKRHYDNIKQTEFLRREREQKELKYMQEYEQQLKKINMPHKPIFSKLMVFYLITAPVITSTFIIPFCPSWSIILFCIFVICLIDGIPFLIYFLKYSKQLKEYKLAQKNFKAYQNYVIKTQNLQQQNAYSYQPYQQPFDVECPYCHSKNTIKITATEKVVNIALFGIFGNKRKYQWHCNNCNSDF